jgi:2-C-methyl-D-erythritol 4-phosphate cytidylyltransferase
MREEVIAIVPAAGLGKRFGPGTNKPFAGLLGKPLLLWVLEALEATAEVTEVIPVLKEQDMEEGTGLVETFGLKKIRRFAPGGRERQDSVLNALRLMGGSRAKVLIHDGARPLIDERLIRDTLGGLSGGFDGAVAAVPLKDTVKQAGDDGSVAATLRRDPLCAVQTPQVFGFDAIFRAYEEAAREGYYSTDDSALLERKGGRVRLVMGSYENIKVTTPEDLEIAELFLRRRRSG